MRAALFACVALLALAAVGSTVSAAAYNKALVIDIGNEWAKVVVMNPHAKSALSRLEMVINEQSNRKTPSIVGITGAGDDTERVLGEDAAGLLYRAPSDAYPQLKRLLGQRADSAAVKAYLADLPPNTHAVTAADGRGTVRFTRGAGASTSVEELFVSLLQYCKRSAEQHVLQSNDEQTTITDAVLIVPEFWTPAQRTLYSQLATIAGLNVRAQLNDLTAVALDYGNRNLDALAVGASRKVVIYNVGSEGAAATLFDISKTDAGFSVKSLASAFDADIGGLDFDVAVREHLIAEFDEKNRKKGIASVRTNKKAMAKLLREARDLKEQLSAGAIATVQVEELFEGVDFAVTLTREKFDDLTRALVTRAIGPIRELFASHAAAMADVQVLELYGGGTRVPAIQHAISTEWKQFGALGKHVDGDEASAFGAGLYAANLNGVPGTKAVTVDDAHVNGAGSSAGSAQEMSEADITALRDTLARFDAAAARRAVTQEARNRLESYVVEVREKLDGPLTGKVAEADEIAVRQLMSKAQDFIDYEVTKDTTAQDYADKLQALKEGVTPLLKAAQAKAEKEQEKQKARDAADEKARERAAKAKASERARDKKYARAQAAKEQQKTQAKAAKAAAKDKAKAAGAAGAKGKAKAKGRDKGDL